MPSLIEITKRQLTLTTNRIHTLPIVILMPHSRCNCRCVMCDIWKANRNGYELSREQLETHVEDFRNFNVREVVFSGGEALMHSNLWTLCELLNELDINITLLSTGLLLERYAEDVVHWCDEVIVSVDGSRKIHNEIRNVPRAYERLAAGVAAVKALEPALPVRARCVLQRRNYHDLPNVIDAAHDIGLDQISFLAADVSSEAFNRPDGWSDDRVADVALSRGEVAEFEMVVEQAITDYATDFEDGFIAESPSKLRRLVRYYAALNGDSEFPEITCNAPWVSTVIEADGTVRPCFFHRALGNIHEQPLGEILNSQEALGFRRSLDVTRDPICRKCVCSLYRGPRSDV